MLMVRVKDYLIVVLCTYHVVIVSWYNGQISESPSESSSSFVSYGIFYNKKQLKPIKRMVSSFSIFPRSPQYELWYIRKKRLKNFEKYTAPIVECTQKEKVLQKDDEPCGLLKPPIWWKDKTGKVTTLPIGNINDYTFERLKEFTQQDVKLSEKLELDHPKKYIPGVIHRAKNPEDTSMQESLERADAFEVVLKRDETLPASPSVDKCTCHSEKHPQVVASELNVNQKMEAASPTVFDNDNRWQPQRDSFDFPKTELERQKKLRELTKPFLHDLHTWYRKNKPTRLIVPIRQPGKKAIPERRFSHL